MKSKTYIFTKENGDTTEFKNVLKSLTIDVNTSRNGKYIVEIKEYRKPRSLQQNRLMWLWFNIIANDFGMTPQDVHNAYAAKFLCGGQLSLHGELVTITKGTHQLNCEEMAVFLDKVAADYSEYGNGATLPSPDDVLIEEYYKNYGL